MKPILYKLLLVSVILVSCSKEEKNSVRLVTAGNTENFQQFHVNVSSIQVLMRSSEGTEIWYPLEAKTGLFDFSSDSEVLLASKNDLPDGEIKVLRFVTKEGGYYLQNGVRNEIGGGGTETSLNLNKKVTGGNVDLKLHFELERSLVAGNDRVLRLKPAIVVN